MNEQTETQTRAEVSKSDVQRLVSLTVEDLAIHLGCAAATSKGLKGDEMGQFVQKHKLKFLKAANAIAEKAG